ncbi:hypothetical protein [Streptomyces physcomitrii]|nr:hypothetical protein [Streptomyces physcomitrii]
MRVNRMPVALAATVCSVALLGACGGGDGGGDDKPFAGESADSIAAKAIKASTDARSMRMSGTVRQEDGRTLKVDVLVDQQKNCDGTLGSGGAKADIRHTGGTLYLRGDEQYWQNSFQGKAGAEKVIPKVADKWVKMPADDAATAGLCDKQGLLASMDEDKSERKGLKKGKATRVGGKEALPLTKKNSKGETLTLYVATEGEPYVLRTTTEGGEHPDTATFSDYGKTVRPQKPADGETVDLRELSGGQKA